MACVGTTGCEWCQCCCAVSAMGFLRVEESLFPFVWLRAVHMHMQQLCIVLVIFQGLSSGENFPINNRLSATPHTQGCIRREGASEAAPEAVGQAAGGGCQSGCGRLLSVTNAIEAGTCCQGDSGWEEGGGGYPPPISNASLPLPSQIHTSWK